MLKYSRAATFLFLTALTLGLATTTFWNYAAREVFQVDSHPHLSQTLETVIYQSLCSIVLGLLAGATIKQLALTKPGWRIIPKLFLLAVCMAGAAFIVYHRWDFSVPLSQIQGNILFDQLNLSSTLITNPQFWPQAPIDALQIFDWVWYDVIVLVMLTTSIFLTLNLARKALESDLKYWFCFTLCLGLLLPLIVDNLKYFYDSYSLFIPHSFALITSFLWDAAPFLGLCTLWLVSVTRVRHVPMPRKIWWVGISMVFILCFDLLAIVAEIRYILTNAIWPIAILGIPMHFWPITPIASIGALVIAIGLMVLALHKERLSRKKFFVASLEIKEHDELIGSTIDAKHEASVFPGNQQAENKDLAEFEVEITDL